MKTPPEFTAHSDDLHRSYGLNLQDIPRIAKADHDNRVTMKDGMAALRATGARQAELDGYALERSLLALAQIAASSGIEIVIWNVVGKGTGH